jgi:hypothetical protein
MSHWDRKTQRVLITIMVATLMTDPPMAADPSCVPNNAGALLTGEALRAACRLRPDAVPRESVPTWLDGQTLSKQCWLNRTRLPLCAFCKYRGSRGRERVALSASLDLSGCTTWTFR